MRGSASSGLSFWIDKTPDDFRVRAFSPDEDPDDAEAYREAAEPVSLEDSRRAIRWRPAASLLKLRDQVNRAFPDRDKSSDGMIGDESHCPNGSGRSDHCPNVKDGEIGIVTAYDLTHDPAGNCDVGRIVAAIVQSRDQRVKYIIWARKICNYRSVGDAPAWTWRDYHGRNPHDKHAHFSVLPEKEKYDDTSEWNIGEEALVV